MELEEYFSILNSELRIQIIKHVINHPNGCKFTEIANDLRIVPSTLEHHLKKLELVEFITHINSKYFSNLYTQQIWAIFNELTNIKRTENDTLYFKQHRLPDLPKKFIGEFGNLEFEVIPNFISILSKVLNSFSNVERIEMAGGFNMQLDKNL